MKITQAQLRRLIVSEARKVLSEKADTTGFTDLANRTHEYDVLVDAFMDAMEASGDSFDELVDMLRDDIA